MGREIKYSDPNMTHEGVLSYREQFNLVPNAGFRRDIATTIKTYEDLCIWQDLLAHWGYMKDGKWIKRNPLDVKGLLTCFEYYQRKRDTKRKENEIREREALRKRREQRLSRWCDREMFALQRGKTGFKG